ncbi:MAG: hypothetical protein WBY53_14970 [Acidobacteriaceae bacterium]
MTRPRQLLFLYQILLTLSDTTTGLLLLIVPAFTLRLMHLHPPPLNDPALPYLSYIGAFVLSTGLACLYGAWITTAPTFTPKLEVVWLLTALTRGCVSLFVFTAVFSNKLETGWLTVAISDGLFAALQLIGLTRNWLDMIQAA